MGKYSDVVKKLEKLPTDDSKDYQAKVQEMRGKIAAKFREKYPNRPLDAAAVVELYDAIRDVKEAHEELEKAINLELRALEQMLEERYEDMGVDKLRLESGVNVALEREPAAQVKDRDAFREWCVREGYANELQLPHQTMNKITKERLTNGEEPPPGVAAFYRVKFVRRRG